MPEKLRVKLDELIPTEAGQDTPASGPIRVKLEELTPTTTQTQPPQPPTPNGSSQPPTPTQPSTQPPSQLISGEPSSPPLSLTNTSPLQVGRDVFEGVGSGVASTLTGLRDLANKGTKYLGLGEIPDVPKVFREAGETPPDASAAFKLGKGGEQLGEFMIPGDLVASGVNAASKYGKLAKIAARTLGEAASAGAVTEAQTGGDHEKAATAALIGGITSGAFATIGGVLDSIPASVAYSKLRLPSRLSDEEVHNVFKDALDNNINISHVGVKKAQQVAASARANKANYLAQHAGDLVDVKTIEAPLQNLRKWARDIGDPEMESKINKVWENFSERYGARPATPGTPGTPAKTVTSPIIDPTTGAPLIKTIPPVPGQPPKPALPAKLTVAQAEDAKNALYGVLKDAYGKLGTNKKLAQKAIARGLKESIEDIVPEVKALNQDARNAKLIETAIANYVRSHPDLIGSTAMNAYALTNIAFGGMGGSHALSYSLPASVILEALRNPRVRSAMVIAAHRAAPGISDVAGPIMGRSMSTLPQSLGSVPEK
jgi:hypothetical protein